MTRLKTALTSLLLSTALSFPLSADPQPIQALNEAYNYMQVSNFYAPPNNATFAENEAARFLEKQRAWGHSLKILEDASKISGMIAYFIGIGKLADQSKSKTIQETAGYLNAQVGWQSGIGNTIMSLFKSVAVDAIWHNMKRLCHSAVSENLCPSLPEDLTKPYEISLIRNWHTLPAPAREKMADGLFRIQQGKVPFGTMRAFLEAALKVPQTSAPIAYYPHLLDIALQGYTEDQAIKLHAFAFGRALQSLQDANMRNHLYLMGPAGTGKTNIAMGIVQAQQLPHCELHFKSSTPLLGSENEMSPITSCLIEKGVLNPVIIVNDIDHAVNHDPTNSQMVDLLFITDPTTKTLPDKYMGIGYDISQVTFIFTANDYVRENNFGVLLPSEAFLQRVNVIKFEGFTPEYRRQVIETKVLPSLIKAFPVLALTLDDFEDSIEGWYQEAVTVEQEFNDFKANGTTTYKEFDRSMRTPDLFFKRLFPEVALKKIRTLKSQDSSLLIGADLMNELRALSKSNSTILQNVGANILQCDHYLIGPKDQAVSITTRGTRN